MAMKYFYENDIVKQGWASYDQLEKANAKSINVRRCRDCEYFIPDHPTIDTNGDFGYCEYRTDFNTLEEEWPIHWYFTDINGFCNEDDITEKEC